ncbi:MAG: hypothetical protein KDC90_03060, partial [Ignavibacteriae bacterium]|nr:hypothetical protein [Ignavibacteriota bacterium]
MKSKIFLIVILLTISSIQIFAQSPEKKFKNNFYFELFGNGFLGSFNYERILGESSILKMGLGYVPNIENSSISAEQVILIPIDYIHLYSFNKNVKLDIGIGVTFQFMDENYGGKDEVLINGTFGYRYQPTNGGFLFRISITPFYSF